MAKKDQVQAPDPEQLKGKDGTFETVTVKGVRMNKHDYDEEEHGPVDKPKAAASKKAAGKSSKSDVDPEDMTVEELKKELDKKGVEYSSDDLKDDLVKKLKKAA